MRSEWAGKVLIKLQHSSVKDPWLLSEEIYSLSGWYIGHPEQEVPYNSNSKSRMVVWCGLSDYIMSIVTLRGLNTPVAGIWGGEDERKQIVKVEAPSPTHKTYEAGKYTQRTHTHTSTRVRTTKEIVRPAPGQNINFLSLTLVFSLAKYGVDSLLAFARCCATVVFAVHHIRLPRVNIISLRAGSLCVLLGHLFPVYLLFSSLHFLLIFVCFVSIGFFLIALLSCWHSLSEKSTYGILTLARLLWIVGLWTRKNFFVDWVLIFNDRSRSNVHFFGNFKSTSRSFCAHNFDWAL